MTKCNHSKEVVCIECNADMTIKEMLEEAHAEGYKEGQADLKEKLRPRLIEWRNRDEEYIGAGENGFYAAGAMDRTDAILQLMASESLGDKPIITAGSHSHTETAKAVGSPSGMPRENSGSPKPEKPNNKEASE